MNIKQFIGGIVIFACVTMIGWQDKPKPLTATLEQQEWAWVLKQIEDSETPGRERNAIRDKLLVQLNKQLSDTTKPKK